MSRAKNIAFLGIMLGIIVVLSWLEFMLSAVLLLPPHIKLGLANIVIMYCVIFVGKKPAIMLGVLKSLFVFLTRSPMAGLLSFCGGVLSVLMIILLAAVFRDKVSYVGLSVAGAVVHNLGQLFVVAVLFGGGVFLAYLPVMVIAGVAAGVVTGVLLKVTLPVLAAVGMNCGRPDVHGRGEL